MRKLKVVPNLGFAVFPHLWTEGHFNSSQPPFLPLSLAFWPPCTAALLRSSTGIEVEAWELQQSQLPTTIATKDYCLKSHIHPPNTTVQSPSHTSSHALSSLCDPFGLATLYSLDLLAKLPLADLHYLLPSAHEAHHMSVILGRISSRNIMRNEREREREYYFF